MIGDGGSDAALPSHLRPVDATPITTAQLPDTPTRDRNIVASAWLEAPVWLKELGLDIGHEQVDYKRRIGRWLLWRSGPAVGGDARYAAIDAGDLQHAFTFRIFADGSGEGTGPSGVLHDRFRSWKEDLRDN
jgi:hypothetical protein